MHAPIELGPRLYGVLTVGHEEQDRFGEEDLELLVKLARSSAAAIANAIDFQRERRIARALTLGFVPESLPELPGYETGLLYAPAANEATGGDVYGAWPVAAATSVAVLVGDVAGKGVETAALSAMVRFFVEARSWDSLVARRRCSSRRTPCCSAASRSDAFVTAFLGILSQRLAALLERRPPAAAARARRAVRPLEGHGLPLGSSRASVHVERAGARAGRPRLRAHGRADRGAPRRRDVRRGAARALVAGARRRPTRRRSSCAPCTRRSTGWADGISDDAVALALRRTYAA